MSRKTRKKNSTGSGNKALAIFIGATCGIAAAPESFGGPEGGVVTGGQGTISTPTSTSTVIDQSSSRLSLNWQSFDVAANESVRFNQPSSTAIAVNRILDQKPSEVFGRIDANGRVVLFNSNGMVFGPGSQINAGSLLATSLDVVSFDETTGRLNLAAAGSPGAIINNGSITAAAGGSVSLVGGSVANNGLIVADVGSVNLAAGRSATLDFYGGGLLRFEADSSLTENASGAAAGVANSGQIYADGGQVLLTTSAAGSVFDRAVNNDGLVRANRIDNSGGSIRLVGAGGTVVNSGVLDASGTGAGTGGSVQVLGENVGLFGNALVDVSGNNGGGVALIGGDYQGANADVINARHTIVNPHARVRADARVAGDGGRVILWSDDVTQFYGNISARGGSTSGNGGFTEVSSHGVLDFNGNVNLGAAAGAGGHLLLDPTTITIDGGTGAVAGDVDFTDGPASASIGAANIATFLNNSGSLTLQATDNIFVNASINAGGAPAGRDFELQAGENINIDPGVTITTSGDILLRANDSSAPGAQSGNGTVDFESATSAVTSTGGTVTIRGAGLVVGNVTADGAVTVVSDSGTLTQVGGTTVSGASLTAEGTVVNLNTAIGTLTSGNATAGSLTINDAGALVVTSATATNGVNITSGGNLTLADVDANAGTATLTSTGGSILDDDGGTADDTVIQGANVVLSGSTGIGSITDGTLANLRAGAGSSVDIDTTGNLTATVQSNAGQINLNFVDQLPTLGAGDIVLGSNAGGATGLVLLQTLGSLNVSAGGLAGLVTLEAGNTAAVGLRTDGDLTLPTTPNSLFDVAPGTLALNGDDILDGDFDLTFDVDYLIFDSRGEDGSPILRGNIGQLSATALNFQDITVDVDGAINLVDVVALGAITVDAGSVGTPGNITVGALNAGADVDLAANFGGAIVDDLDVGGTRTRILGNELTMSGTSIGSVAQDGEIDTDVDNFTLTATNGDIVLLELNSAGINAFTAAGGNMTRIATEDGSMSVNDDLNPLTGDVELLLGGASSTADLTDRVVGRQTDGTGNTTVRVGNDLTVREVVGDNIILEAGFPNRPAGDLVIDTGAAATQNVRTTGNVTLRAAGTITQTGATIPSVVGNQLTISRGTTVDLDTNVNTLNATLNLTGSALTIREASGPLTVDNARASGAVNLSTTTGSLNDVNAAGSTVTLNSNTTLSLESVTAGGGAGAVNLTANGGITDGGSTSVNGGTLTINGNPAVVTLSTNVTTLAATTVGGPLTIREANGLTVNNSTVNGAVDIQTTAGDLTLANLNAGANTALLRAGGNISNGANTLTADGLTITGANSVTLNTNVGSLDATNVANNLSVTETTGSLSVVAANSTNGSITLTASSANSALSLTDVNAANGTVTLSAGTAGDRGAITETAAGSVSGATLDIDRAESVNLSTDVATLTADNVETFLTVVDQSNDLMVQGVTAGGAVSIQSAGTIQDQDAGTTASNTISGASVSLTAATGIGTVTDLATRQGVSVDVDTAGVITANVTNPTGGAINLNLANAPANGTTITLGSAPAGRDGDVLLQSAGALDLRNLPAGFIGIGAGNTVGVGFASGGVLRLSAGGLPTDFAPADLLVRGTDIFQGLTDSRTIDLSATGTLTFDATAAGGAFQLNTNVGTLNASTPGVALNVDESGGNIVLGTIAAQSFDLQALGGAILDDGTEASGITAQSVVLESATGVGAAGGNGAIDVNTSNLTASSDAGDVAIRSTGGGALTVNLAAGDTAAAAGNGNISLTAAGNVTVAQLAADQDTANVTTTGSITGAGVTANQLTLANASSVDLDTNVNTLAANNIAGNVTIDEASGPLAVTNVTSNNGSVALTVAGGGLSLGTVSAANGTVTFDAGGAITDTGTAASVTANTLTIAAATSADLDTDVDALDASNVGGALTVRETTGSLAVTNATATGAVTVSAVAGSLTGVTASGSNVALTAGGTNSGISLTQVNAGAGNVTLTAGSNGAITDGGSASVAGGVLTIGSAGSVNLNTNVATLAATGVANGLTVRDANALQVNNATSATGLVNLSTVGGALSVANASGVGVTLNAGGAGSNLTLGTVSGGAGAANLTAGGALSSTGTLTATGGLTIASATSVDLRTDVNTLNVTSTVGGALSVAEQTGGLVVTNANATGAVALSTVGGLLDVTNVSGAGVSLTAGGAGSALTLRDTVNAGATGTATLTAGGALTDTSTDLDEPSLIAGAATLSAASIGTAANTVNTSVNSLSATSTAGGMFFHELNSVTLTNLNAANNQDIFVGAREDITVERVNVTGTGASGRVLLAAGRDILASGVLAGTDAHITAQNVELRAGGMNPAGGRIGTETTQLRLFVPEFIQGGAGNTGANVPSVLFLQRPSAGDATIVAQEAEFDVVSGLFQVSTAVLPTTVFTDDNVYLTPTFTVRSAQTDGSVSLANSVLPLTSNAGLAFDPNAQNNFLDLTNASNAQGEGTLYIDWASFDPNVSLFGTVNPPICLPRDQQEEDDSTETPAAGAKSSGCSSTTAQYEGLRLPQLQLVITSRGLEWVPVTARRVSGLPTAALMK